MFLNKCTNRLAGQEQGDKKRKEEESHDSGSSLANLIFQK